MVPFSSFAPAVVLMPPYTQAGHRTKLVPRPPVRPEEDPYIEKEASQIMEAVLLPESPPDTPRPNFKRQLRAFFVSGLWYDIGRLREADPELRSVPRGLEGRALMRREMLARTRFKEWRVNWSLNAHEETQKKKRAVLRRFNSPESPRKKKNASKTPVWNKASIDKMTRRKRIVKLCMNFLRTKLTLDMDLVQYDDREIFPRSAYYMPNSKVFFMYIRQSQVEQCSQMLAKNPNLIYQVDDRGRSALHLAVIMRSAVVFDMLLKHKPKLDLEDSQGFRPIDFVLSSNQGYMLKELLVHGAYPFARIYSDRVTRTRIYPSLAFMLESAICLWVGGYFSGLGLRRRRKRYLAELGRVLKGT